MSRRANPTHVCCGCPGLWLSWGTRRRSEKEIIRRQDLLTKLRNQKEKLEAWIRQPKASTREQRCGANATWCPPKSGTRFLHARNMCVHARSDLMAGGAGYDQSGYPTSGGASSASSARRGPRVFGQETDKTRGVDNQGVLQVGPTPVCFIGAALPGTVCLTPKRMRHVPFAATTSGHPGPGRGAGRADGGALPDQVHR